MHAAKTNKVGFKVFVLGDAIAGYVNDFIYFSKANEDRFKPKEIIIYFSQNLKNHHIYMDNWYTSVNLSKNCSKKDSCNWNYKKKQKIITKKHYSGSK